MHTEWGGGNEAAKPNSTGRDSSAATAFPVVGLGASAGGLEALEEFFRAVPRDSHMAYVVVTHLHPGHASMLPELLTKVAAIPVVEAEDGVKLQSDRVYVSTPGVTLTLENGVLHRIKAQQGQAPHLPIDSFFRSLAEDQHERAICIVLSGTGSDGTLGLKAVKGESGMVMVQDTRSAAYTGMPVSAAGTGLADYLLRPGEMPPQLVAYANGAFHRRAPKGEPELTSVTMQRILSLLHNRTGHDFRDYKTSTVRRRIDRRMSVHGINDPGTYVRFLQENPQEIDLLFKELLITVTRFFRDPEAFEHLGAEVLPEVISACPDKYTFRVWVPGCATGEEAYSLAILLYECMQRLKRRITVQIFATDLDAQSIEFARTGVYPEGIASDLTHERLERYFHREDSTWRVSKEIREMVIFAPQNIIKDPPFTKLDLLSCRNLLIYLNADLQKRLLPMFHYALKLGGMLLLGPSESVGSASDLFTPIEKKWKIFRRKDTVATNNHPVFQFPTHSPFDADRDHGRAELAPQIKQAQLVIQAERLLLSRYAPTSLVINERGDILYIHGRTGEYLEPVTGQPSFNVLDMAREGLQIELAAAIRHATAEKEEVVRTNVRVRTNGDVTLTDIGVSRITQPESIRGLLLVTLKPSPPPPQPEKRANAKRSGRERTRVRELERELQHTRESLQTTVEELETSNEELKSANEELQSMNEEMQSTNEELETSKEEMQSLNEELTTVNAELQSTVEDLSQANDDMQNLLNSTEIATIFLDNELNIKRFTEKAKNLVKLIATDVGRPLADLAINLQYTTLVEDCREVLETLVFSETEVQASDGSWHLMRIMPYRTAENVIDGLVITFVEITRMKALEVVGGQAIDFVRNVVDNLHEPMAVLDDRLHVLAANQRFFSTFQLTQEAVEGEELFDLSNGVWDVPKLRTRLRRILSERVTVDDFSVTQDFPAIGRKTFHLDARLVSLLPGVPRIILLAFSSAPE